VEAFRRFVASDKSVFDFNKVLPMPEELSNSEAPSEDAATNVLRWRWLRHSTLGTAHG